MSGKLQFIIIVIVDLFNDAMYYSYGQRPSESVNVYDTGTQEWHIVSLFGDVTSPTSAVHYVSMMSELLVLSTEKQEALPGAPTAHGAHKQSLQCKGEAHSSQLNK